MDKSWMLKNRLSTEYEAGVEEFIQFGLDHNNGSRFIRCPCLKCGNRISTEASIVRNHLYVNGVDQSYKVWFWHGEELDDNLHKVKYEERDLEEYDDEEDDLLNVINMVETAHDQVPNATHSFDNFVDDAKKPLYPGCKKFTKLSALVRLYNLKVRFGWSNSSFSELLSTVSQLLPEDNELPRSMYEAKKTLNSLGLTYQKIDACPNDCCLYRNEFENLTKCPTCNASRWKVLKNTKEVKEGVGAKSLWYFPIIPRLIRLFKSPDHARNLVWHATNRKNDSVMRHPADSPSWRLVDHLWPSFGAEPRNIRFGLSTDGVNPYGDLSSKYSCWPVIMTVYNLPPWLCMRKKFLMLSMLISGPKQPGYDIHIYLAPLIEDLNLLWDVGVECFDGYKQESFTLRAILLWTINDFPAYGNLCGCTVKGYKACPVCGEDTDSIRLHHGKRNAYMGHRKYLPRHHPYRRQKKVFDGNQEMGLPPHPLSGLMVLNKVRDIAGVYGKRRGKKSADKSVNVYWKRRPAFFDLPYWKDLHIRHCLDVMHVEKNVCMNLIGTLLDIPGKTKDGLHARLDLVRMNLRPELAPVSSGSRTLIPAACYTLKREEKYRLCKSIAGIKVPDGYSSNIGNLVSLDDLKITGLKSHDCHVLIQQFLPIALRGLLPKNVRYAITRLCLFFNKLCYKSVRVPDLERLQEELVVTLCSLEKYFPPSFFTIMMHLTIHLVREVKLCGPVYLRWMYPFERYMKVLKGYVRNRAHPEGCIAEAYICEEAVEFCSEFLTGLDPVGLGSFKTRVESQIDRPLSAAVYFRPNVEDLRQAHLHVLENTNEMQPYRINHMEFLKQTNPRKVRNGKWVQEEHNRSFPSWLRAQVMSEINEGKPISNTVSWMAHGPNGSLNSFEGYRINGCSYSTQSRDKSRTVQNSGVSLVASTMQVASARDKRPIVADMSFYGIIQEIWEISYNTFAIPIFKCNWVESHNGVRTDDLGFTLVNLNRIGHVSDSFVLATQARQVFYVEDPSDPDWSIVVQVPLKDFPDTIDDHELGDTSLLLPTVSQWTPTIDDDDVETPYIRDDCEGTWVNVE